MKKSLLALTFISLIFGSCSYGPESILYREHTIASRTKKLLSVDYTKEACSGGTAEQNAYSKAAIESGKYDVLLITDVHIGAPSIEDDEEKNIAAFLAKVDSLTTKPAFCVALGDFADHGRYAEFEKYDTQIVKQLKSRGIGTFNAVGNHDLYNSGWNAYQKYCYPNTSFYVFKTKKISWYFLDTASCAMGIDQRQKMETAFAADSNAKIICTHVPLYADGKFNFAFQNSVERDLIISDLTRNNTLVYLTGHTHERHYSSLGSFKEENVAALFYNKVFAVVHIDESSDEPNYTLDIIDF